MSSSRRAFLRNSGMAAALALVPGITQLSCGKKSRPNILWLIGEDMCPDLGCYGNELVYTPNIDKLASQGVRFTNAFTTAPVCSASRSAFMTGMYQTTIGAHNHRSHRRDGYRLPPGVHLITDYFRKAGYFTANVTTAAPGVKGTGKTDFNFTVENPFDGTDWNQREEGQPFYAQINFKEAHRVFKSDPEHPIDPDKVHLPPYYPDHPIARKDWALYLETIQNLDKKIGAVLQRLEDEGLADNTVIFFLGDHGRAHVRGKQFLYDGGIHIPLIIRWPGTLKAGTVSDELISAIDIAATSLWIAGIALPKNMQGQIFLGAKAKKRDYIVAARDRCDETVDRIRCIRSKRYKYIRNFYPDRPYTQLNRYKECQYPVLRLMRRLHAAGKLTPAQDRFMADTRPPEELYDLQADPFEIHNLASSPEHQAILKEMRSTLDEWIRKTNDKGEEKEDPAVIAYYEQKMKANFDERIKKYYQQEGMKWKY